MHGRHLKLASSRGTTTWIRSGWHTDVVLVRCVRFCRTLLPSPASMASLPVPAQASQAVMHTGCQSRLSFSLRIVRHRQCCVATHIEAS